MRSQIERRISKLEEQTGTDPGEWCPACGYGQQVVILEAGEPEPVCQTCRQQSARASVGVRVIAVPRDGVPA